MAFLDRHPETAVCFHPVRAIWEDGREDRRFPPVRIRDNLSVDALIWMNFIQTNSVVYRRLQRYDRHPRRRHAPGPLPSRPPCAHGKIAMLPETMAVYRRHAQGMWHNQRHGPSEVLVAQGPGHAAMFDAMLDLFPGDPVREELIGGMADWVCSEIAKVPGPEGRATLQNTIARHPRCAMLALQHRWANDPGRLLAKVESNPDDGPSVLRLAQHYFDRGDFSNARKWYERRAEMGGSDEEIYYAMYQIAESMSQLGEPWPDVQDAYLRAWQFRPTRAEPLHAIASRYRVEQRYKFAYLFAERAAKIPLPEEDRIFVSADVYAWRATDEQAVCASWIGRHAEAFTLCRRLLARPTSPTMIGTDCGQPRLSVPAMIEAASPYPEALVQSLPPVPATPRSPSAWSPGRTARPPSRPMNSFLNCCLDVSRVGRFVVLEPACPPPTARSC